MERARPVEAVLLLNASYIPLGVISWMKAVSLLWQERAEAVVNQDLELHSPSLTMPAPSVVRLNHMVRRRQVGPRLSRRNLFYRDAYTCQYCGQRFPARRRRGGKCEGQEQAGEEGHVEGSGHWRGCRCVGRDGAERGDCSVSSR